MRSTISWNEKRSAAKSQSPRITTTIKKEAAMRTATMLLALVVVLVAAPAWAGDLQAGVEAYNRGDYATALKIWRPLAEQGHAKAQYDLGVMYFMGRGVPQDVVQAHLWLNLAAAQGDELARINRDRMTEQMTPAQLADAQRLAGEWKLK